MTACWCRLIQPENSRRKKVSGGGSESMAEELASAPSAVQRGARLAIVRRHTGLRLLRYKLSSDRFEGQCRLRFALSRVFAHDAVGRRFAHSRMVMGQT